MNLVISSGRGPRGNTILSGMGAPASGLGTNGDFYLDTAVSALYGPKSSGAWPTGVSLTGQAAAALAAAVAAAGSATAASIDAAAAASSAAGSAGSATSAALSAGAAQALINGKLFASTSAGIAGTTNGQYFFVAVPGATSLPLYLNVSGTATDQSFALAGKSALDAAVATVAGKLSADEPYLKIGGIADSRGRYIALFAPDGSIRFNAALFNSLTATNLFVGGSQFGSGTPYGYSYAWRDANGRVTVGIKNTGELSARRLVNVDSINGKEWSELATVTGGAAAAASAILDAEMNHFDFYGQSKPAGMSSTPPLTTTQLYDGLRFSDGVRPYDAGTPSRSSLVPLIETTNGALGETPAGGFNETLKERIFAENGLLYTDRPYQMVLTDEAQSGSPIANLAVGTAPYNAIKSDIDAVRTLAQAAGKTSKFRGFGWSQGESDYSASTLIATYRASLTAIRNGLDTYAKAGNLANGDVLCFIDQVYAHAEFGHPNDPYIALDQLALCNSDPHYIMVGNLAFLPENGAPHWSNVGSKWAGAYYARAYKRVIIDGGVWAPLQPVESYRDGNIVMLRFKPESGKLAFDTSTVGAQTSMGFTLADPSNAAITINSVALVGNDMVKIVAATSIAAGSFVRNGYGGAGLTNLRDTMGDTIIAGMGGQNKRLDNWGVIFNQTLA